MKCSPHAGLTSHKGSSPSAQHCETERLIDRIIQYENSSGDNLMRTYTLEYLTTLLDKNKIESIDKVYHVKSDGFNLLEFVRFFLNALEHSETQTLYLTMALVDLFRAISQANSYTEKVKFLHLTDFICHSILGQNSHEGCSSENKIQRKLIPTQKFIKPQYDQRKTYITNPPIVYGNTEETVYKVSQNNAKIDKNKHDSVVTNCFFSATYRRVFSLDALSDCISVYDENCRLVDRIRPATSRMKKDIVVLGFAYSSRQERIGAVLKNFTLSFWDLGDNLEFEKVISTASCCPECQTNIWFLDYFQSWVTSDKAGIIYVWDLEKQVPERTIDCLYRGKVNDICEIACLNILAVVQQCKAPSSPSAKGLSNSSDSNAPSSEPTSNSAGGKKQNQEAKILLYNFKKGEILTEISTNYQNCLQMRSPHTIQYSDTYQVLLSGGYEKKINIFELNHQYLDISLKGQLLGHENIITSFTLIRNTSMVCSSDDKGKVKIWDLRNFKCLQTLDFRDKTIITQVLDMVEIGKLAVLGSRINFLEYDDRPEIIKKYRKKSRNAPIRVNYVYGSNNLLLLTKNDLRFYNMHTGCVDKVVCDYHQRNMTTDNHQDGGVIFLFRYYELLKKILIGNEKGEISLYPVGGETGSGTSSGGCEKLEGFADGGSLSHVEYDEENKLFLTCGGSTINIQKFSPANGVYGFTSDTNEASSEAVGRHTEKKQAMKIDYVKEFSKGNSQSRNNKLPSTSPLQSQCSSSESEWTVIRQMKGNFHGKDITTMALSVYHGMVAVGSTSPDVYIWDYEYAKLLFHIRLQEASRPTEQQKWQHGQQQMQKEQTVVEPTAMAFVNGYSLLVVASNEGKVYFFRLNRSSNSTNSTKDTVTEKSTQSKGSNSDLFVEPSISPTPNADSINTNKMGSVKLLEVCCLQKLLSQQEVSHDAQEQKTIDSGCCCVDEILLDVGLSGMRGKSVALKSAKVFFSLSSGKVVQLDIQLLLQRFEISAHCKNSPTYNAERQLREQFSIQLKKDKCISFDLRKEPSTSQHQQLIQLPFRVIQAHSGHINSMRILEFDRHYLLTCGVDERVKIWDFGCDSAELKADFNVNLPLPYKWNLTIEDRNKTKDRIMFALKIIQSIFRKYGSDISTTESKLLKLQGFFKHLKGQGSPQQSQKDFHHLTEPQVFGLNKTEDESPQATTYLFQNEFTKRDLHFEEIKKFNFHEIGGPSLREIDFKRKIEIMQKQWQSAKDKEQIEKSNLLHKIQQRAHKNEEKEQVIGFLQDKSIGKKRIQRLEEEIPLVKSIMEKVNKLESNKDPVNVDRKSPLTMTFQGVKSSSKENSSNRPLVLGKRLFCGGKLNNNINKKYTEDIQVFQRKKFKEFENHYRKKFESNLNHDEQIEKKYLSLGHSRLSSQERKLFPEHTQGHEQQSDDESPGKVHFKRKNASKLSPIDENYEELESDMTS